MSRDTRWDDYRTAYAVAHEGSLSQAAKILNVNHATVLRHVNRLELDLGLKLFIRHQRGYQLTDAGRLMVAELPNIQHSFSRLENQLQDVSEKLSGQLKITTVPAHSPQLNPAIIALRREFPELRVEISATDDVIPLEKGIVHVAVRPGAKPDGPDLIVKKITDMKFGLYAAKDYLNDRPLPDRQSNLNQYDWVMPSGAKRNIPFIKQLLEKIDPERLVYQSNNFPDISHAVIEGLGIGPLDRFTASHFKHLQELDILKVDGGEALWFVYHKDLKHSRKINILYQYVMEYLGEDKNHHGLLLP